MSTEDAISAVNELVLAVREALLCGARATDTDATGALTEMYNRSEHATQCIDEIKQALLNSLSPAADAGVLLLRGAVDTPVCMTCPATAEGWPIDGRLLEIP